MQDIQLEEAKYLLEKLLSMTVNQCCLATQKDGAIKEMENRFAASFSLKILLTKNGSFSSFLFKVNRIKFSGVE